MLIESSEKPISLANFLMSRFFTEVCTLKLSQNYCFQGYKQKSFLFWTDLFVFFLGVLQIKEFWRATRR